MNVLPDIFLVPIFLCCLCSCGAPAGGSLPVAPASTKEAMISAHSLLPVRTLLGLGVKMDLIASDLVYHTTAYYAGIESHIVLVEEASSASSSAEAVGSSLQIKITRRSCKLSTDSNPAAEQSLIKALHRELEREQRPVEPNDVKLSTAKQRLVATAHYESPSVPTKVGRERIYLFSEPLASNFCVFMQVGGEASKKQWLQGLGGEVVATIVSSLNTTIK